jgi:tRNA (adenine-N(1)-)-methyltransferase non-catalytic subunit
LTYEILEKGDGEGKSKLRVVPAAELHANALDETERTPAESRDEVVPTEDGPPVDVQQNGDVLMRNNRLTIDDGSRQTLSYQEIEDLKKMDTGSGKELIAKIVAAHSNIDEKTAYSLAKYIKRKHQKYLKRFAVLPLDVNILTNITLEKEPAKIMELRIEHLGLITSWANIHHGVEVQADKNGHRVGGGRWVVVDDTGGLVVAAMADKMGILYPTEEVKAGQNHDRITEQQPADEESADRTTNSGEPLVTNRPNQHRKHVMAQSATHNSLTVIHANTQPNLALLRYFDFVVEDPDEKHPLYTNLKTLSWLQFLDPEADALYREPPVIPEDELAKMKSGKKGNYYRKRRRWQRIKSVVEETQAGGFDGLVVASFMKAQGILKHLVPLIRGGGHVVVYSPTIEPLTELMDLYSRERKSGFTRMMREHGKGADQVKVNEEDFPLNPTLLLNPMLQTARARHWQVLPGRTHPLMTSKGGAEGYIFSATRVLPSSGRVEARGKFGKKRKAIGSEQNASKKAKPDDVPSESAADTPVVEGEEANGPKEDVSDAIQPMDVDDTEKSGIA